MKKLFVVFIILFLLCGCAQSKSVTPVLCDIAFTADAMYANENYVADATVLDGTLNLVVKQPNYINGLTLVVDKNGATAEFMGVSYPLDINSQPQGAIAQILYSVFIEVADQKINFNDNNGEISGRVNNYNYTFVFSPAGLPISLKIDEIDLLINFSNVTLK